MHSDAGLVLYRLSCVYLLILIDRNLATRPRRLRLFNYLIGLPKQDGYEVGKVKSIDLQDSKLISANRARFKAGID